eukprot:1372249-Pyramimonas_sp.AAC.1
MGGRLYDPGCRGGAEGRRRRGWTYREPLVARLAGRGGGALFVTLAAAKLSAEAEARQGLKDPTSSHERNTVPGGTSPRRYTGTCWECSPQFTATTACASGVRRTNTSCCGGGREGQRGARQPRPKPRRQEVMIHEYVKSC